MVQHEVRRPVLDQPPPIEQEGAPAQGLHGRGVVGDEEDRGPRLLELLDPPDALVLEIRVADRECLVEDQDLGASRGRHREGEAHAHAGRVGPDGLIDVLADLRERLDLRHQAGDLPHREPHELARHHHVLAAAEVRMKAHPQLEQGRHAAPELHLPLGRLGRPREDLEQRALPGAVQADDAHRLPRRDPERDPAERPEGLVPDEASPRRPLAEPMPRPRIASIGLAQAGDGELAAHSSSTIGPARCRNTVSETPAITVAMTHTGHRSLQTGHRCSTMTD